jgi:hypothetical protein
VCLMALSFLMYALFFFPFFAVSSQISHYNPKNTPNYFIFIQFFLSNWNRPAPKGVESSYNFFWDESRRIHKFEGGSKNLCVVCSPRRIQCIEF